MILPDVVVRVTAPDEPALMLPEVVRVLVVESVTLPLSVLIPVSVRLPLCSVTLNEPLGYWLLPLTDKVLLLPMLLWYVMSPVAGSLISFTNGTTLLPLRSMPFVALTVRLPAVIIPVPLTAPDVLVRFTAPPVSEMALLTMTF